MKPCTKKIVKQIVYTAVVDIPYIMTISLTNGDKSQADGVKGAYKGALTSVVETSIEEEAVC